MRSTALRGGSQAHSEAGSLLELPGFSVGNPCAVQRPPNQGYCALCADFGVSDVDHLCCGMTTSLAAAAQPQA